MDRNSVRLLGLLLLVPSLFLALMPYLVAHTMLLNAMAEFNWTVAGTTIAEYHKDLNGEPLAQTWWGVWVIAVFAEILLLGVNIFRPPQPNRFKISVRG